MEDSGEINDEYHDDARHTDCLIGNETPNGVHIRGCALEQVSGFNFGMISKTQALNVVEEKVPQAAGAAFGGLGSKFIAEKAGESLKHN